MSRSGGQLTFDAEAHASHHLGVKLNSVTRILIHSGLVNTAFMTPGTEFLDRGTAVHEYTARHDLGEPVDLRGLKKRWRGHYRAWLKFRRETGFEPTLVEHYVDRLYRGCKHKKLTCYCFVGILDRLGTFPEDRSLQTLLDIKNCKTGRVGDWVRYQLVGYGHALDPSTKFPRVGVALHEDGSYSMTGEESWPVSTWDRDLATFLRASRDTNMSRTLIKTLYGN